MDMDRCEHYIDGDDENLLLDDENKEKKCVRCRKQINLWMNGDNTANINWTRTQQNMNGSFLNDEPTPIMSTIIDEYSGNLEDSPLLINDCYKEQDNKEFHCHDFAVQAEDGMAWKKLLSVLLLCCLFMIAELVGGYFSGSIAIMTDAAHLLSDCLGFFISLIAIWVGRKSPD
ncbi:hypothetical protein NQ314_003374 [Rhamnusium bicolor]|uniref:Cation efflux protein transmembrane domain-containing protein n=1 Tax=Rhamnusium bicolor TaxID=1586634 RepID=A0AAV8ZQK9_9CUCU|nr:hypothetical protein NQ314_003374 [Rhamnusium bicolor]